METQAKYTIIDEKSVIGKQLEIIEHYGIDRQLEQLTEESGELIVAICKWKRDYRSENCIELFNNLIEETADVKNLIEQLELISKDIEEGIERFKEYKVNREIDRISKVK